MKRSYSNIKLLLFFVLTLFIVGFIFSFFNAFYGNPISKAYAKYKVKNYIDDKYDMLDLKIDSVGYNFKVNGYVAQVYSENSIDTHFDIYTTKYGKATNDSYSYEVSNGWNTYRRLEDAYSTMVDQAIEAANYEYTGDIYGGKLVDTPLVEGFPGLDIRNLELDREYDINEVAKYAGSIIFYAYSDSVSIEKTCEILIELKNLFDEAGISFCAIDLVLEKKALDEKPSSSSEDRINIANFLYRDIYLDGLEERVQTAHDELTEYYKQQDMQKK